MSRQKSPTVRTCSDCRRPFSTVKVTKRCPSCESSRTTRCKRCSLPGAPTDTRICHLCGELQLSLFGGAL